MHANEVNDGVVALSPLVMDDAREWLAGEDEEQIRWFEFPRPATLDDVQRFIAQTIESWRTHDGHWYWGIRQLGNPALVGGVDLRDLGEGAFNLSYVTFLPFRRHGYATRASRLAIRFARDKLSARSVIVKMLAGNEYSVRVAERLGALYTGVEPSDSGSEYRVYRLDMEDFNHEQ